MKKIFLLVSVILFSSSTLAETPPSDASLNELLQVSNAKKLVDDSYGQIEGMLKNSVQQAFNGQTLNAEQQKAIDDMNGKTLTLFKSEISWEKLQPIFVKIYKESFSQEEVNGMLTFYKSPAGQAVVKKMPTVMQSTMTNMQTMMQSLLPQIQKIQQEGFEKIKANATHDPAPQDADGEKPKGEKETKTKDVKTK